MEDSRRLRQLQWYVFLLVPIVNFGANYFFDNPFDDVDLVYIQPANYAFAIWGPIFIGMIFYSWYQKQDSRIETKYLRSATLWGISAGLASICFVPIPYLGWQWLSMLNILWHLVSLVFLFIALKKQVDSEDEGVRKWYIPTQMYLGWICAATAVSVALFLKETGVAYGAETEWIITCIVLALLTVVGIFLIQKGGMVASLVLIWALIALIVQFPEINYIMFTSSAGIIIISVVAVMYLRRKGHWIF